MKNKAILVILIVLFTGIGLVNAQDFGRVIGDKAVIRSTPSASAGLVAEIDKGLTVEIMAEKGEWLLIQTRRSVGWMHIDDVDLDQLGETYTPATVAPRYITRPKTPARTPVQKKTRKAAVVSSGYIRGPRGGCYYMSGRRKVYVDRSLCAR